MMLRQEAALYRSIHATGSGVRILLRLRLEFTNLSTAPPRQDDGAGMENVARHASDKIA
jgi:hypothetical protein